MSRGSPEKNGGLLMITSNEGSGASARQQVRLERGDAVTKTIGAGVVGRGLDGFGVNVERDDRRSCSCCGQCQYATASSDIRDALTCENCSGKEPRKELAGQKQLGVKHGRENYEAKTRRPHRARAAPIEYEFVR